MIGGLLNIIRQFTSVSFLPKHFDLTGGQAESEPPTRGFSVRRRRSQGLSRVEDWRGKPLIGSRFQSPLSNRTCGSPASGSRQDLMRSPTDGSGSRAPAAQVPGERRSTRPGTGCSPDSPLCACGTTTGAADGSCSDPTRDSSCSLTEAEVPPSLQQPVESLHDEAYRAGRSAIRLGV